MYKILYNMYFYKFKKENRKENPNWTRWEFLDKQCEKYSKLINKKSFTNNCHSCIIII